ncbi:helix-turn-helix transcriptional regulator [Paraburkholderia humisilvae]|uniref:HTH luxR-type domain-containing protein n=1 Tax=Paraburkholderia humisilvae TaxID=627669 RepID=A0A6J5F7U0_9BURK|nr:LuxR C-terminal-related transcriptional regulator [Paraburkholderia humisilvae]CAB3773567.1 hypothetical protein LMG29542_07321 [Paraburkholderia humisilvae]
MQSKKFAEMRGRCNVIYEADIHLARDRIVLRLRRHSGGILTLERRSCRGDGTSFAQIVVISNLDSLREFASTDVCSEHLRTQYHAIERVCSEEAPIFPSSPIDCSEDVLDAIGRIQKCASEGELMVTTGAVLKHLGITSYTYKWVLADEKVRGIREQRCLIGCHPGWVHAYSRHRPCGNDVLLDYIKRRAAPAVGSEIEAYRQDRNLRLLSARYGFGSVLVCAAHPPGSSLFGVLQVGSRQIPPAGECALWRHRVLIRAIAGEILDWRVATVRDEAARATDLDHRELHVLRLLRNGRTACNVADNFGISERSVYLIFRKINQKLGVSHIARAVERASANGLIE